MEHQPFEDWLFSEEPLTPHQTAGLEAHLQVCEACRMLSQAWKEAENQLIRSPIAAPEPGFTDRWQERLAEERRKLHKHQSLLILGFSIAGASLLLGSLALLALPALQSPRVILWVQLYRLMGTFTLAEEARETLSSFLLAAAGGVPFLGWLLFTGLLSELAVLWMASYRLLTKPRQVTR